MRKPFKYQEEGVECLTNHPFYILGDEMGLGKTGQIILTSMQSRAKKVLVVCPNSLKQNWANEFNIWHSGFTTVVTNGDAFDVLLQTTTALQFMARVKTPIAVIVNYERYRKIADDLDIIWDVIVFDEAHRVKNRKSQNYLAAKKLKKNCYRMYMVTGTPILGKVDELWTLLNLLYPREFTSYWRFVENFCDITVGWGGHRKVKNILDPDHPKLVALRKLLSTKMIRRKVSEVIPDLPQRIYTEVPVTLSKKQRELYKQMEDKYFIEYEDDLIQASIRIAQDMRLRQIAISPDLLVEKDTAEGAKFDAILDLIDSAQGESIIVFSLMERAITRLNTLLTKHKYKCVRLTGKENTEEREKSIERFQNKEAQIILCTISAGGVGLNLNVSNIVIFLDKDLTPAINDQAIARTRVIGRTEPVRVYDIIAEDTVEQDISKLLSEKREAISATIDYTQREVTDYSELLLGKMLERRNKDG
jgi:SNF2 family DNA or RNA helicase